MELRKGKELTRPLICRMNSLESLDSGGMIERMGWLKG